MAGKFELSLRAFANSVEEKADEAVRNVVLDVWSTIKMRSPVGDPLRWKNPAPPGYVGGRFRANWQYTPIPTGSDVAGALAVGTISKSDVALVTKGLGVKHRISNSSPYAWALERGHSGQAPQGIVGLTILEFRGMLAKAVREARRK